VHTLWTTNHILILPAEGLDGVADVSVPLEAFVSVVCLGWVPGEGALDWAEAGQCDHKDRYKPFHDVE
jgi:hypothetical protein